MPLKETVKLLKNKPAELTLDKYNQRFFAEFSQRFSSYDHREHFFDSLVKFIYEITKLDFVLVGKADSDGNGKFVINTIAITAFGELTTNITYPMWKGPCYEVVKGTVYSYPKKCKLIFPENKTLVQFNVEGYLGYPLYGKDGNAVGLIALMHQKEIEDHETIAAILRIVAKRAEFELDRIEYETALQNHNRELQLTGNRLQSTFDGVPAMITLLDVILDDQEKPVDFVISVTNKAAGAFAGCDISRLIGNRMTSLYPGAFGSKLIDSYIKAYSSGEPQHLEFLNITSNKWFSIYVTKQVGGNGIVSSVLEITAQKKAEEERKKNMLLTELDKVKTEFFSNASHEFRTPLTLILDPIQQMVKKFAGSPLYSEDLPMLHMVHRNVLRLEKLVNTLLNFSQIEAGRSDAIFKPTDVAEYTTLLAANFRSAFENAGLKFIVNCKSAGLIYLNKDMWEKIVLNLLSNAFKFTFEGTIEIKLRSLTKHVKLEVRDTGIGIKTSDHSKIFDRFTRIPNVRSRSSEGTGIGLALINELVKIHGGNIKVKSREGQGATFIVSVPRGKSHLPSNNIYEVKENSPLSPLCSIYSLEAQSWTPSRNEPLYMDNSVPNRLAHDARTSAQPKTNAIVLVVDDNSDMREYIRSILTRYILVTANNGRKALDIIDSGVVPDLIIADLMMPEMNGFQLLKKVRENSQIKHAPFIMLSAKASEEDRLKGMRSGADDYVVKPFSSAALLALVDSRLQRRLQSTDNRANYGSSD